MKIMVSACLIGENCKYNGGNNYSLELARLLSGQELIPVCPEMLGGLPAPRFPGEIRDGIVVRKDGVSMDREFRLGAEKALKMAKVLRPDLVILQSRSPSCGVLDIYDGSFSGKKIPGQGVFARMMLDNGFRVLDAAEVLQAGSLKEFV